MKKPIFEGAGTAIVTPFHNGEVDHVCFRKLLDYQAEGGVSAIIVCGTTGEAATLSEKEKLSLYDTCIEHTAGRMKVICGIGSNNTAGALHLAREAEKCGADAVMMVTPYYNKTSQTGLVKHFSHVADNIGIPLIIYNVPSRTGIGIQTETYRQLAEHPNINGVKEASGNIGEFGRAMALCGEGLNFWSGNDADTVAMMALGAKGVVSVASNLLPDAVARLCQLCLEKDYEAAAAFNARYAELFHSLFIEVNPIPIKTSMEILGLCSAEMRLPLCSMEDDTRARLVKCINKLLFT